MKKILSIAVACMLWCGPALAADAPMDAVKKPLDRAMNILNDPQYKDGQNKQVQKDLLWECIEEVFDFVEVGKRALGKNWRIFTPEERKDFCAVFSKYLGNAYLNRIQGGFEGETISYLGEEPGSKPDKAVVLTKITRPGVETPVDYSLMLKDGQWEVYDVKIEGISLVTNYRSQFDKLLMNEKPAALIKRLQDKLDKQDDSEDL